MTVPALQPDAAAPASATGKHDDLVAAGLVLGIALALVATVLDAIVLPFGDPPVAIRYKALWRALPIVWLMSLAIPAQRRALAPRWRASDVPLALFAAVAALSVWLGGGRFGDVRSLVAAIGVGWMARALFAAPARRAMLLHLLGGTLLLVLVHELRVHPRLLPIHEMGRYDLVTANPNVLGFLFAMVLPIVLAETLAARGPRGLLGGVYTAAAVIGTLLTFSRTAALGAVIGAAVVVLTSLPRARAAVTLLAIIAVFAAVQRPDRWTSLRSTGDAQRLRIIRTSLALAAESPLLGVGFGINNLERVFPDRYEMRHGKRVFRYHSMNQIVDLLVGTGIIGTALALWWAGAVGRAAVRRWRAADGRRARLVAAGGLAACVAIAVMSMGEPPLYHGKLLPILFLVLAGVESIAAIRPRHNAAATPRQNV